MTWNVFENGNSIGSKGSEEGVIIFDEEHTDGARITIEENGSVAPYSITCGIYGLMVHTAFFSSLEKANSAVQKMKSDIENIMVLDEEELYQRLDEFTVKY